MSIDKDRIMIIHNSGKANRYSYISLEDIEFITDLLADKLAEKLKPVRGPRGPKGDKGDNG